MSEVKFDLRPIIKNPWNLRFTLSPIDEIPSPSRIKDLTRNETIQWAEQYDIDHPWWIQEEQQLRKIIKEKIEINKETLHRIIHWKFLTLPGREKLVKGHLEVHTDEEIRTLTKRALSFSPHQDKNRIKALRKLNGIGIALASTILTFNDPQNYGIYDIHVYREMYGPEPTTIFTINTHYIQMLQDLRRLSKRFYLPARTIEKALFKKNLAKSNG